LKNFDKKSFQLGFVKFFPIATGVVPFGAVMGSVAANAGLSLTQSTLMNLLVFGGASQLAVVDLMKSNAPLAVVVVTGLIINLRFILYSAAIFPVFKDSRLSTKLIAAHSLTDQSYTLMTANQDKLESNLQKINFFFGSCLCMWVVWHASVIIGFLFGNFAPSSLSLDYAVPLSFIALVIPTLKNKSYVFVAVFAFITSILLRDLPFRMGLIVTTFISMFVAAYITRKKSTND
jgi:predicted branched-subunit amino acid permease